MQLSLIPRLLTGLSNLESSSMYQGPVGYINITSPGDGDDPEFFRLDIGQALNLRARLEQHVDPNYRKRYPSLQYGIMDASNRPLRTICYGQFPTALHEADPEIPYTLLNILEELGSLIFQTQLFSLRYVLYPNHPRFVVCPKLDSWEVGDALA